MSELSDLLESLPNGTSFTLVSHVDRVVSLPSHDEAFVRPVLNIEKSHSTSGMPPIILISAPGAVGKSALARFIAAEKQCHLWDLSRLRLGTNTFKGTLANAFDDEDYSQLVSDLRQGKILFVLDAFDEAEIVSGWPRVEEFLNELFGLVKNASGPSLILLARSTTAQYMDMYLSDLATFEHRDACHMAYSIDYFVEARAVEFVRLQLDKLGRSAQQQHESTFRKAVDYIFSLFFRVLKVDKNDKNRWQRYEVKSFLGYAPVLQAIARYLSQVDNYVQVHNEFHETNTLSGGTGLVAELMNDLLVREHGKFINQLRQAGIPEAAGWDKWDSLYAPTEQLMRVFLWVQSDSKRRAQATRVEGDSIPSWLVSEYATALENTIETHPFMLNDTFAGPAFRDYAFARLLAEKCLYDDVKAAWHHITADEKTYAVSPLFALLYRHVSEGDASGDLAGYLYESAVSRQGFQSEPRLTIVPTEDDESDNFYLLQIVTEDEDATRREVDMQFRLKLDENTGISFTRKLVRAYVEVNGTLSLGRPDIEFELSDSEIVCEKLEIHANSIVIRNYREDERVSIEAKAYGQISSILNIDCNESGKVSISWPGGQQHPWSNFYHEASSFESYSFEEAVLALRRFLSFFRKDRKNHFARYKQLVDNVVVGKKQMRRDIRDYLISLGIISYKEPLYYLDMKMLEERGINFDSLRQADLSQEVYSFIKEFLAWTGKP